MYKLICLIVLLAFVVGCDCCGCKPCEKGKDCVEKCDKSKCGK